MSKEVRWGMSEQVNGRQGKKASVCVCLEGCVLGVCRVGVCVCLVCGVPCQWEPPHCQKGVGVKGIK